MGLNESNTKSNKTWLWIAIGIVSLLLMCCCTAIAIFGASSFIIGKNESDVEFAEAIDLGGLEEELFEDVDEEILQPAQEDTPQATATQKEKPTATSMPVSDTEKTQTAVSQVTKTASAHIYETQKAELNIARTQTAEVVAQETQMAQTRGEELYAQVSNWRLLLSDQFNSSNESYWTGTDDEITKFYYEDGEYIISIKGSDNYIKTASNTTLSNVYNFYAAVEIRFIDSNDHIGDACGLLLRHDGNSFYEYVLEQSNHVQFRSRGEDSYETVLDENLSTVLNPEEINLLEIIAVDDQFYLFVNQELLAVVEDSVVTTAGWLQLEVVTNTSYDDTTCAFDSIEVRSID